MVRGAANANVAVPPNLGGPQSNRIWKAQQAEKAKEAKRKREQYEEEAAAEAERLKAKKSKQPAGSKKKATSNGSKAPGYKARSQALPPEEVDENNAAYGWGAAGNEQEIPELEPDAMPFANDEDRIPDKEDESSEDDGGEEGQGGGEDEGSEEEDERLLRIPRRAPRLPPPQIPQTGGRTSEAASNRMVLALRKLCHFTADFPTLSLFCKNWK